MNKLNKFFLLILISLSVSSKNIEANPDIEAQTAILMDHHSNEILYELNLDKIYQSVRQETFLYIQ